MGVSGAEGPSGPTGPSGPSGPSRPSGTFEPGGITAGIVRPGSPSTTDNLAFLAFRRASAFVFVTSTTHTGNLGGLAGADAICNSLAVTAGLPGEYMAWLATTSASAPLFTFDQAPGAYLLTTGELVANNWADLVDGAINTAIDTDELGGSHGFNNVWTNVDTDGSHTSGAACNDWTNGTDTYNGGAGNSGNKNSLWTTYSSPLPCNALSRLYCLGIGG